MMMEMMFGAGSPIWTAMPPVAVPYPSLGIGPRAASPAVFSAPVGNTGIGAAGAIPALPGTGLTGIGPAFAFPWSSNPFAGAVGDGSAIVTASSLLSAVALRRGQPQGPANDAEVEEFLYDALDLLPGAAEVEVRCENGRVTLTGTVQHKRTKRDVGELAWAIPGLQDVQNNVSITSRRRARAAGRESESAATAAGRKQG